MMEAHSSRSRSREKRRPEDRKRTEDRRRPSPTLSSLTSFANAKYFSHSR